MEGSGSHRREVGEVHGESLHPEPARVATGKEVDPFDEDVARDGERPGALDDGGVVAYPEEDVAPPDAIKGRETLDETVFRGESSHVLRLLSVVCRALWRRRTGFFVF
jgi:hypothetical protein